MIDKIRILSTVSIYHAFNDGAVSVIPLLFPIFRTLFDLSYTQVGLITGGGLFVTLVMQVIIGRISDHKNRRTLLSIGILILSGSLLLLTQINGFLTLFVFILLLRFAAGFYHPTGIGWISQTFKKERLDWAMGMQSAFGNLGGFIAISTTLLIVEYSDWYFLFYLWAIGGIFCLFLGMLLTRKIDKKFLNNSNKKETKISFSNEKEVIRKIKVLVPGFVISGAAWGMIITYLPLLMSERTEIPLSQIGLIVSIWLGIGTIICLLYGKIHSLIGRKNVIIISYLTIGLVSLALTTITETMLLIILMVFLGITTFLTYPCLFSFVSEVTDSKHEGKTFAYIFTFQLGGGTVLLFLGGLTADIWGIWTPFAILGSLCLMMTLLLLIYRNKLILNV